MDPAARIPPVQDDRQELAAHVSIERGMTEQIWHEGT